jgi:O-antigen/teichoic acid export membrane protein
LANLLTKNKEISKNVAASTGIKVFSIASGFLITILLTKFMGVSQYGVYAYVMAIASILSVVSQAGLPSLLLRETVRNIVSSNWCVVKSIWQWSSVMVTVISLLFVFLIIGMAQDNLYLFAVTLSSIIALGKLRGAALQGLHHVILSHIPDRVIRPTLFILLLMLLKWIFDVEINAERALLMGILASGIALIYGIYILHKKTPKAVKDCTEFTYQSKIWMLSALPMALTGGALMINSHLDLVILGWFVDMDDIGIYRVVVQSSGLVLFSLSVVNMFVSPYFAKIYKEGNLNSLRKILIQTQYISFLIAIFFAFFFYYMGEYFLSFVFGVEYVAGYYPLIILVAGNLINAAFGSVGLLLNMTGHEKQIAKIILISLIINATLNFILIPKFGLNGAAVSTSLSVVFWNIFARVLVYKKIGV